MSSLFDLIMALKCKRSDAGNSDKPKRCHTALPLRGIGESFPLKKAFYHLTYYMKKKGELGTVRYFETPQSHNLHYHISYNYSIL